MFDQVSRVKQKESLQIWHITEPLVQLIQTPAQLLRHRLNYRLRNADISRLLAAGQVSEINKLLI